MDRELVSKALGAIDEKYVAQCAKYRPALTSERTFRVKKSTRKIVAIAIAACLLLALSITAVATGTIEIVNGMNIADFFAGAFGKIIPDKEAETIFEERDGYLVSYTHPATRHEEVDIAQAQELLGDCVTPIDLGYITDDGKNEFIIRDFLMDENGIGVLSFEVRGENQSITGSPWLLLHGANGEQIDSKEYILSKNENSTVFLAYFAPFANADYDNITVSFFNHRTLEWEGETKISTVKLIETKKYTVHGFGVELSPIGIKIGPYFMDGAVTAYTGWAVLHLTDGTVYEIKDEAYYNATVSCTYETNGGEWITMYVFNRLIDLSEVESVDFGLVFSSGDGRRYYTMSREESPEEKAQKEWYTYWQKYVVDGPIVYEDYAAFTSSDEEYSIAITYGAYNSEMFAKLYEIADKYNLRLQGGWDDYRDDVRFEYEGHEHIIGISRCDKGVLFPYGISLPDEGGYTYQYETDDGIMVEVRIVKVNEWPADETYVNDEGNLAHIEGLGIQGDFRILFTCGNDERDVMALITYEVYESIDYDILYDVFDGNKEKAHKIIKNLNGPTPSELARIIEENFDITSYLG